MSRVGGADGFTDKAGFLWSVAELLRGDFKAHEYAGVILPLTVLRRLDCAGQDDLPRLLAAPANLAGNLRAHVAGLPPAATELLQAYRFDEQVGRLERAGLLFHVVSRFADVDLHPDTVPNHAMGYVFEELLRRFAEMSNEAAGEHFTPREVVRLMVGVLFAEDADALRGAPVRTLFDCACGTGGMLTAGQDHLAEVNPRARLEVFGQELNPETWAIARSDLMLRGEDPARIRLGNSLSDDQFAGQRFDYMLANPPFGVDWRRVRRQVETEHERLGHRGRFGAGLPRVSDGSLLFLQHLVSKMKPVADGGSRIAVVFSGSPLFSGGAGSGESEIRRWVLQNDWLEAVVALPDQLFYNTGIATYFWVVTNRKSARRRGKVVLVDARAEFAKMRRSLGDKRKHLTDEHVAEVTRLYVHALGPATKDERVRVLDNDAFGYQRVTVERPSYDEHGRPLRHRGGLVPDPDLRDTENVPLTEPVDAYLKRAVLPYAPDAWVDESKTRIGFEIPFTRHFARYAPPRPVAAVDADLRRVAAELAEVLRTVTG